MHDLSRNLFYKTSFDIESAEKDDDALWCLVRSIKHWVGNKCKRNGIAFPEGQEEWTGFRHGGRIESADGEKAVVLSSESFWNEEDVSYWSCSVTEKVKASGHATREWVTEIGFSFRKRSSGTVYLVLSYADRPGYLGELQPMPNPSIPGIVRDVIGNKKLKASVLGQPLSKTCGPTLLHVGDFPVFWTLVANPKREVPIIFVSPRFDDDKPVFLVDPQSITAMLGPSALVYCTYDKDFCAEMGYSIPSRDLRCSNGTVRIYAPRPNFDNPKDFIRHRFFTPANLAELGQEDFLTMLRRVYAQDVNFYEHMVRNEFLRRMRIQDITHRDYQEKLRVAENEGIELAGLYEEQYMEADSKVNGLEDENDSLRAENHSLKCQVESYETAFASINASSYDLSLSRWPLSSAEIMELMRAAFPERVDYSDRAIKSFDTCGTRADVLWNAMFDLCTIAYALYASEDSVDISSEFNNRSEFEFARNAGMQTRKDSNLMESYVDTYQGRQINAETHIKKGTREKDETFLRIYFGFDREAGKIIVSHIGKHLANYTTRSIS